jgi:hypothetical protein
MMVGHGGPQGCASVDTARHRAPGDHWPDDLQSGHRLGMTGWRRSSTAVMVVAHNQARERSETGKGREKISWFNTQHPQWISSRRCWHCSSSGSELGRRLGR